MMSKTAMCVKKDEKKMHVLHVQRRVQVLVQVKEKGVMFDSPLSLQSNTAISLCPFHAYLFNSHYILLIPQPSSTRFKEGTTWGTLPCSLDGRKEHEMVVSVR